MDHATFTLVLGTIVSTSAALKAIEYFYGKTTSAKNARKVAQLEQHQKDDFEHLKSLDRQVNNMDARLSNLEITLDDKVDNLNDSIRVLASFLSKTTIGKETGRMTKDDLIDESQQLNDYFIRKNDRD